mmetsp:Transcript_54726/g.150820  ORF Transcript_54726/g.150820 Transcript_54726/m.150820 type:complete len:245 (-) Transcript_54726:518-1252(-)
MPTVTSTSRPRGAGRALATSASPLVGDSLSSSLDRVRRFSRLALALLIAASACWYEPSIARRLSVRSLWRSTAFSDASAFSHWPSTSRRFSARSTRWEFRCAALAFLSRLMLESRAASEVGSAPSFCSPRSRAGSRAGSRSGSIAGSRPASATGFDRVSGCMSESGSAVSLEPAVLDEADPAYSLLSASHLEAEVTNALATRSTTHLLRTRPARLFHSVRALPPLSLSFPALTSLAVLPHAGRR